MNFKVMLTYGKDEMEEFQRLAGKTEQKGRMLKMRLLYLVFAIAGFVGTGYLWSLGGNYRFAAVLPLIFGLLFLYRVFFFYRSVVGMLTGRSAQSLSEIEFFFSEDGFRAKNQYQTVDFDYDKILRVYETERSFVLFINSKEGYVLPKDAFKLGKPDDFRKFIARKSLEEVQYVPVGHKEK